MSDKNNNAVATPAHWHKKYDSSAKEKVAQIIDWLNANDYPIKHFHTIDGNASGRSRIDALLKGSYTGAHHKHLDRILNVIALHDESDGAAFSGQPFYKKATVSRIINHACRIARTRQSFSLVTAYVGTGKTRSINEYAAVNENTFIVECIPNMSASAMLNEIVDKTKIRIAFDQRGLEKKFLVCVDYFKNIESPLIIIDEAETASPKMLHYLRRLRDRSGVGVLLSGTPDLEKLIMPTSQAGEFNQIRSRVSFAYTSIKVISDGDIEGVLKLYFPDDDINAGLFKAFKHYCKNSMRMLVENIIPNVKEFGLEQGRLLTPDVVHDICKKTLAL